MSSRHQQPHCRKTICLLLLEMRVNLITEVDHPPDGLLRLPIVRYGYRDVDVTGGPWLGSGRNG